MSTASRNARQIQPLAGKAAFTFEPLLEETQEEYSAFAQFLESDPMQSPARWLFSRDMDVARWSEIASRNSWVSRRIDYWNYASIRQRVMWVNMLESYGADVMSRRKYHTDRIDEARRVEKESGELSKDFDRAVKSFNEDVETITRVIEVLTVERDSVMIVNNAVGSIGITKDISTIAKEWDKISGQIIDGESKPTYGSPLKHSETE